MAEPPQHHLSELTAIAMAGGALDPASTVVTLSHVDRCPVCHEFSQSLLSMAAGCLTAAPHAPLSAGAVDAALARICSPPATKPARPKVDIEGVKLRWIAPGLRHRLVGRWGEYRLHVIEADPGVALPCHAHDGREMLLILSGRCMQGEKVLGPGDVSEAGTEVEHDQVVVGDVPCRCLLAVTGRLRFKGWLTRLYLWMIGI